MVGVVADRVVVELEAKLDRYDANVRRAEQTFAQATTSMERNATRASGLVGNAVRGMGVALAGVSAVALAREFLRLADTAKSVDAQLKLATQSFGTLGQAQEDVTRIAGDTRSALSETSSLYASFTRAAQSQGKTQMEAARAVETFNKALLVGGAGQAQAASATLQLGQALGSVTPQWEELGQVFEASPRIQRLIAESLGVTTGQLKTLVSQGKLTSSQLFDAFTRLSLTKGIDAEFKELPTTFEQAMQQVENAAVLTFGAFDKGGQFSTMLADFITGGSDGFADLAKSAEQFGIDTRAVFDGLANVFDPIGANGNAVFDALGIKIYSVSEQISSLLGSIDRVRNFYAAADNIGTDIENGFKRGLNRAIDRAGGGQKFVEKQRIGQSDLQGDFERGQRRSAARGRMERSARNLEGKGFIVPRNPDGTVNEAGITRRPTAPPPPKPGPTGGKPKAKGPKGPSAETLANRAESVRLAGLRNDEAFEGEKFGLQQDLLRAQRAIVTASDAVAAYELQEVEAARARQNASYERDVSEKKLTRARADELIALNNQVAAARAEVINAERLERARLDRVAIAEADASTARDILQANAALATTEKDRRAAALRLLDLEFQMERARLEAVIAAKASTEAEKEIARRRLAALPELQAAERAATERQNAGPLGRYRQGLEDPDNQIEQSVADKLKAVDDAIADAAASVLGVKDPFLRSLLQIFLQQNVLKPLYDAMSGAGGGGGGGLLGIAGTLIGGLFGGGAAPAAGGISASQGLGNYFATRRASGGHVSAGQMIQVNDGGRGVEGFQPGGSGKIIPLGQMNAAGGGGYRAGDVVMPISISAPGANAQTVELIRQTLHDAAPSLVQASQRATMRALGRKRIT